MNAPLEQDLRYASILAAANSDSKVGSLTHPFYRYPARFGETFVREVVQNFSDPGDVVLDPFCGGGTTIVESLAWGRHALGSDLSELATLVADIKTTPLSDAQLDTVGEWCEGIAASVASLLNAHSDAEDVRLKRLPSLYQRLLSNLKDQLAELPQGACRRFATGLLLKTSQWAFDGKQHLPTPTQFVGRMQEHFLVMRHGMVEFVEHMKAVGCSKVEIGTRKKLRTQGAASLSREGFGLSGPGVSLVVTSPPYLGVHVLYNRWQLQGRRELHAPYYLTDCADLGFPSRYTIVPRASTSPDVYFESVCHAFKSVRNLLRPGAYVVQLVSFGNAATALPRYMDAMKSAGLEMCETYLHTSGDLTWRSVPGRRWYARVGAVADSSAAQEVLLVHRAGR